MAQMKPRGPADEAFPVDRLASDSFGSHVARLLGGDALAAHTPRVNITERHGEFRLEMEVPGFDKKDLKVEMVGDTLTIRGAHTAKEHTDEERYTRREFERASFARSFVLPTAAHTDKIDAEYANGVLTLTIPKVQEGTANARQISIK